MTYLVVAIIGALIGIALDRWWGRYIAECDSLNPSGSRDLRTIEQRRRAHTACTYNAKRWD